jgi:hypothetical protein
MTTKFSDTNVTDAMAKVKVPKVKVPLSFEENTKLLDEVDEAEAVRWFWKMVGKMMNKEYFEAHKP